MRGYGREDYAWLVRHEPSLKDLVARFPAEWAEANEDLAALLARGGSLEGLPDYVADARAADERIRKSGVNPQALAVHFPRLLKARMIVLALRRSWLYSRVGRTGRIRFSLRNGRILQRLLFRGPGFERKPVPMPVFRAVWPFVGQKALLMPLVGKKGIYCFYSRELVRALARLIGGLRCIEIAAGDGTLTRFLAEAGVDIKASDDGSWSSAIGYPAFVERLDAREALRRHGPQAVVCSWPPPGNPFEKQVFATRSVDLYVVIGSSLPFASGDRQAYESHPGFDRKDERALARLLLPPGRDNAVTVFRRMPSPH